MHRSLYNRLNHFHPERFLARSKFLRGGRVTALIATVSLAGLLGCELYREISQVMASSSSAALGLNASFQPDGALRLSWLTHSPGLHDRVRGLLEISDGPKRIPVALDATALLSGSVQYERQTDDVDVRLTVYNGDGTVLAESVRVVNAFPPSAAPQAARAAAGQIPASQSIDHVLLPGESPDPLPIPVPEFVLAAKPVQQLAPLPVVAAWYPPPIEELGAPLHGDSQPSIASTGARLASPTFPNGAP